MKAPFLIGIDESGRGPIAGPLAVSACLIPRQFYRKTRRKFSSYPLGKDSKKLSEKERNFWFGLMKEAEDEGLMELSVVFISHSTIDRRGLSFAIKKALGNSLKRFSVNPLLCDVFLDGGLKAPDVFKNQKTIVKGDEKEWVISLASIVAKVTRDRKMISLAQRYKNYGFEKHKGYGTKAHYEKLLQHGICPIHRRSFLRRFLAGDLGNKS
ncbi:MAG: ribonuclease HII [bacterium]|nr:ribonuclease HII [bacterium]